ncbi:MAG: thioredoxin domain-containing protein [Leptospiraceae bacterium]|nr:thioredoxin domain-containing protein [Leptospiraceae bacterium]
MKLQQYLLAAALLTLLVACDKKGPSISVGSYTVNESTLESEMPEAYDQLRSQYEQQVYGYLKQLATQKMVEMAAAEKGQSAKEYFNAVTAQAKTPGDAEIQSTYEEMMAMNPGNAKPLNEIRGAVIGYIMENQKEILIAQELGRLRKKYGYKDSGEVRQTVSTEGAPSHGPADAPVTIVEFSDFECPYCARAQESTVKLRDLYGDKIRFVFRHFPLSFHQNAMYAHIAGRCIYQQAPEQFWKYFDAVFALQRTGRGALKKQNIDKLVAQVGVNPLTYQNCVANPETKASIESDIEMGGKLGVTGTPAFFINGRFLNGAVPLREFVGIIEEEIGD